MTRWTQAMRAKCAWILVVFAIAPAASAAVHEEVALHTSNGPVGLDIVQHASFVLQWNGQTLYVDPVGPAERYAGLPAPDMILITHAHGDHLSPSTLAGLDTHKAIVVEPPSVAEQLGSAYGKTQHVMVNGDSFETNGLQIQSVAMYNLPAPGKKIYHAKGWGNGYVLTLGGKRIYISGDTEGTPELRALKHIDLAFLCMNLPYTMNVQDAAKAALAFKPAIVYPYHYRGQDTTEFKRLVDAKDPQIDVRLRDWYAK